MQDDGELIDIQIIFTMKILHDYLCALLYGFDYLDASLILAMIWEWGEIYANQLEFIANIICLIST